ncbi:type II toxin-antitoxin system RelE/ParE family toxin [Marinihelvus fidelis]|uniref:Type II toxin-antitoxin system RelE/ParE family toxin n=1 Tax=Marinihelvus fidelis TaxID=2613842 RepID=A0A5N0TBY6_9GAMM|nr:type II toxin-antitoxin system RelE/ParE family toxin [Marinihelvus fidelis]KAA9131597.1 type II toxin-antitoxin system RelE/ParE family toxin [Marinihelvus fidelis]
MAQVVYSARAIAHLQRSISFLADDNPGAATRAAAAIRSAVDLLGAHPLIGHEREHGLRELVISYGQSGYIALYRFRPHAEEVRVLAIRHQHELDYPF